MTLKGFEGSENGSQLIAAILKNMSMSTANISDMAKDETQVANFGGSARVGLKYFY